MDTELTIAEKLKEYGVGRRKLDDNLFHCDDLLPKITVYDYDDEALCHEVVKTSCHIPGCIFTTDTLLEFENHYNTLHRYTCSQCKKVLPSPHLLDLHIQEKHDSFFAVMASRNPSYCCYIEECNEKFINAESRLDHCVKIHKLPKDFRFDQKPKKIKPNMKNKSKNNDASMDLDNNSTRDQKFSFSNSKQKAFAKYTGKKFTDDKKTTASSDVNMDDIVGDLKENLP